VITPRLRHCTTSALLLALCATAAATAVPVPAVAAPTVGNTVTLLFGDGNSGALVAGPGAASPADMPWRLATDADGDLYMAFAGGSAIENSIVKYTAATGDVQYVANDDQDQSLPVAGPAVDSPFDAVDSIAVDSQGNLYASDYNSADIVKITPGGTLSIVAGTSTPGAPVAGVAATAATITPKALAVGPDDSVYFLDEDTYSVWRVNPVGNLEHVAGDGSNGVPVTGTGQAATASPLVEVVALAVDSNGNVFIVDQGEDCVVMVQASTGDLLPAVGSCNNNGSAVEGPATASGLSTPGQIALDKNDDLYLVDQSNGYIEKVTDPASGAGTLSIIAGDGSSGDLAAGAALSVPVDQVTGIAVDDDLNVYLGEGEGYHLGVIPSQASAPGAPTGLSRTVGEHRVTLTFVPPADDGGSAILRYQYSLDNGVSWRPTSGNWSTTTSAGHVHGVVSGLAAGSSHTVRVRAVNGVGAGAASGAVSATVPDDSWFHDTVPPAERNREIAIPVRPKTYHGPRAFTRALNTAHGGELAMPIPSLHRRDLAVEQAAVLSDRGLFEFNSARLTARGRAEIEVLVDSLSDADAITCEGYTDYAGALWWEYKLSAVRAKAVCAALTRDGYTERTRAVGYGPQRPVVVGGTATSREANRRVVVLVTR
jgi:outer membrane protein OmpA-like peptidoglycan-associated protein